MKGSERRRGSVLRALLIVAAVVVTLMLAAGVFVARNVHVLTTHAEKGDDVSIETPAGKIKIRTSDRSGAALPDVPIYPGAVRTKDGGGASFEWTSDDGQSDKRFAVQGADLITPDDVNKVLAYYRTQLADWIVSTDRDGSTKFERKQGGYRRFVNVRHKSDGTHIGVASAGEPAAN